MRMYLSRRRLHTLAAAIYTNTPSPVACESSDAAFPPLVREEIEVAPPLQFPPPLTRSERQQRGGDDHQGVLGRVTPRKASNQQQQQQPDLPPKRASPPLVSGNSLTSETATSVSSSLRSSSLSFLERTSGGTDATSATGTATTAETSSSSDSDSEAADHLGIPLHPSATQRSNSSASSVASSQSMRSNSSIADYRQLRCSMTYKNRAPLDSYRTTGSVSDGRLTDTRMTDLRMTEMSGRISEAGRSSRGSRHSSSPETSSQRTLSQRLSRSETGSQRLSISLAETTSTFTTSPIATSQPDPVSATARASEPQPSEVRMTEANVAAMQTRRALQQMVLSMEDEDSDYESESEHVRSSSSDFSAKTIQVSADDYRKFQFRLRQLEDLCQDQARRQANMEDTIEIEVRNRTKRVVEAMEKNIAMYKQAKELEVEREIQKRMSEMTETARGSHTRSLSFSRESSSGRQSTMSLLSSRESERHKEKGKPLEKIFHPRRARRRLEMLKEREEQQKREMEQFREFIRTTEMSVTIADDNSKAAASAALRELNDPQLTDALLDASQKELIDMICMLRKHVSVQEAQLDEAKQLISTAIEAREEAEDTAREAVELTIQLDSRLERASQEIVFIRDELRESQRGMMLGASPASDGFVSSSPLRTSSRRYSSNYSMHFGTPS
ncbi:hypothetical protein FI667_g10586, partial [Globisporangium splendens]